MVQLSENPLNLTVDLEGSWTRLHASVCYQTCIKTSLSRAHKSVLYLSFLSIVYSFCSSKLTQIVCGHCSCPASHPFKKWKLILEFSSHSLLLDFFDLHCSQLKQDHDVSLFRACENNSISNMACCFKTF